MADFFPYSIHWPEVASVNCFSDAFSFSRLPLILVMWDNLISPQVRPYIPGNPEIKDLPGDVASLERLFYHKKKQNAPKECVNWPLWENGKGVFNVWNDNRRVARHSCSWYAPAAVVSLLYVRQWSSRMGGLSGAEIGRVCRGVWASFVSGERGLCSLNQGGGTNRLSL